MTTIEKSVGVRGPASTVEHTAEDTPHDGVVTSNRPGERTDEVNPTTTVPDVVAHDRTGPGVLGGPGSPTAGGPREHRADDGQHMA
ncbi:hypothetical protein [Umezawaea sp.]|uniref:hypothetical protein n=1 Tax=Umezawaea sp. TaxID=1955258 RepID=UPI002ED42BFE